jgi:hypothetical protein
LRILLKFTKVSFGRRQSFADGIPAAPFAFSLPLPTSLPSIDPLHPFRAERVSVLLERFAAAIWLVRIPKI